MAEAQPSLELLLSCQVCFEEFTDSGDHVPRVLPCSHTLCHSCVGSLIQNMKLQCPECRTIHNANNQEKSFPQNKDKLALLARKSEKPEVLKEKSLQCEEHGKELQFFCREDGCKKPICGSCIIRNHRQHDIVEIEDIHTIEFKRKVGVIRESLNQGLAKIIAAKDNMNRVTNCFIKKLITIKEELDDMIAKGKEEQMKIGIALDSDMTAMKEHLSLLEDLTEKASLKDVGNQLETVKDIEKSVLDIFGKSRMFTFKEYTEEMNLLEALRGNIVEKELTLNLSEVTPGGNLWNITHASQLTCKVESTINTGLLIGNRIYIAVVDGNSVAVSGVSRVDHQWKLYRLNIQTGATRDSVVRGYQGVAVVELGGSKTVAVSYVSNGVIEFQDVNNLQTVIHTHQVAPRKPYRLCVSSPSTLLYEDVSKWPKEVCLLDCSGAQPKPVEGKHVIKKQIPIMNDMCVVRNGDKELLVCACDDRLEAYNMRTDETEWSVKRELDGMERDMLPWGVTTDGRGHLFVTDHNNDCIQMFHVADGRYLGALQIEGLETPRQIQWCEATSSLVVLCIKGKKCNIQVVSVKANTGSTV